MAGKGGVGQGGSSLMVTFSRFSPVVDEKLNRL